MDSKILKQPAGILIKTTCLDYPGLVAGTFFLKGCNLRCPYCYNTKLIKSYDEKECINEISQDLNNDFNSDLSTNTDFSTIEDLFHHLEKRKNVLEGLVISGGEPLLNQLTPVIIKQARKIGYKIKLDTNGTFPEKLSEIINNKELCPDFIAMDLKTSPDKYHSLLPDGTDNKICSNISAKIINSIKILASFPKENREWRTVLVPGLISQEDIKTMAQLLPSDATWRFAEFQRGNCLNPSYNEIDLFSDLEIKNLIETAKETITDSSLR